MNNPWYVTPENLNMRLTEEELAELKAKGVRPLASEVTAEQAGLYCRSEEDKDGSNRNQH